MRPSLWLLAVTAALLVACGGTVVPSSPATPTAVPKLTAPLPAYVQQKGKLSVGVKCDYPPFGLTDANGQIVGYEIDMVRRMAFYAFGSPDAVELQCVV